LNRGRHLCSAGRPSDWALAHILMFCLALSFYVLSPCFEVLNPLCGHSSLIGSIEFCYNWTSSHAYWCCTCSVSFKTQCSDSFDHFHHLPNEEEY